MKSLSQDIRTLKRRLAWLSARITAAWPQVLAYDAEEAGALRRTIDRLEADIAERQLDILKGG
jgi:hypothetical protein